MKSVRLHWCLNNIDQALSLLEEALKSYSDFPKLWMMKGQIYAQTGAIDQARDAYNEGIKKCPTSIPLWILLTNLEIQNQQLIRARATLEKSTITKSTNTRIVARIS